MTTSAVRAGDLRDLLDSDLPDPRLVLHEGRVEVVAGDDRRGLDVVSRDEFTRDQAEFTDQDLEQRAAALSAVVANLGA
ncbi:hypothetical protein ACFQV2_26175 [Actinokineospora soli]|uniref:Uncharacterized protein n=1 Tax=Actinokineospora soli TaxID=1048753 RepID=A0ABW2TSY1_9PSEU